MYNVEIDTASAVVEEASKGVSLHDVVAVILFAAVLTICGIQAVSVIRSYVKKEWDWHKKPLPFNISLIARGIIGATVLFYVIWLLADWSSWSWSKVYLVLLCYPLLAALIVLAAVVVILFVYWSLYVPLSELIGRLRKH